MNAAESEKEHLGIFVNRRKFEEGDGVKPEMTGAQIAALVDVPADNAVVRLESGGLARSRSRRQSTSKTGCASWSRGKSLRAEMNRERIERELALLRAGGQTAELIENGRTVVLYRNVPTDGVRFGLPGATDVVVPVPAGYAAAAIDLAGLPVGSPLLPRLRGGQNNQGIVSADGRQWQLASYHPHNGGGGPPWGPTPHG